MVHPALQLSGPQGLPHQPEAERVCFAAALDALVTGVTADVVELVLLEEVGGAGRVAALQKALEEDKRDEMNDDGLQDETEYEYQYESS